MAILTPEQLERLRQVLRDAATAMAVSTFGWQARPEDLARLVDEGYIREDQLLDLIRTSFTGGLLQGRQPQQQAFGFAEDQPRQLTFDDLLSRSQGGLPLSEVESRARDLAAERAGQYCVGLGNRWDSQLNQIVIEADQQLAARTREVIRDETRMAIEDRRSRGQLRSDLTQATKDWTRDWDRIAHTEMQQAHQEGVFEAVVEKHGDGELLAKVPDPGACDQCKGHYLDHEGKPIVRPAMWWAENGTNVGKKQADWKAVLGTMHPHCRCELVRVPAGWEFTEDWELVPAAEKSMADDDLEKGDMHPRQIGLFTGPRGGKWADAQHTIPYQDPGKDKPIRTVFLVSCVSQKGEKAAPAAELYQSDWFKKAKALARKHGDEWMILSAKHGLVHPDQHLEPYNETLNKMSAKGRRAWAEKTATQLKGHIKPGDKVVLLAGTNYREHLMEPLKRMGALPVVPMQGLGIGQQKQWLKRKMALDPSHQQPMFKSQLTFGWEAAPHSKKGAQRKKRESGPGYAYRYEVPTAPTTGRNVLSADHQKLATVCKVFVNASGGSEKARFVPTKGLTGMAKQNVGVQIVASEIPKTDRGLMRYTRLAQEEGLQVMVDSGEFGRFSAQLKDANSSKAQPLDFDSIFDRYEAMAADMPPGTLTVVAPDRIAEPKETADLRARYADRVRGLMKQGAEVIVPIQARNTKEIEEDYIRAAELFGEGFTIGFPTAKNTLEMDQILPAVITLYQHGRFPKVHLLGGGDPKLVATRTVQLVAAAYFSGRGLSAEAVAEMAASPARAAGALRNLKTGPDLMTMESDTALWDRAVEWWEGQGMSADAIDDTEIWEQFFEAHPEEFDPSIEDKEEMFGRLAGVLIQSDTRVVGTVQQHGLHHDPVTGTQTPAPESIMEIPKAERHPPLLQAYLTSKEYQHERHAPGYRTGFEAMMERAGGTLKRSANSGPIGGVAYPGTHDLGTSGSGAWMVDSSTPKRIKRIIDMTSLMDWLVNYAEEQKKTGRSRITLNPRTLNPPGVLPGFAQPVESREDASTVAMAEQRHETSKRAKERLSDWLREREAPAISIRDLQRYSLNG